MQLLLLLVALVGFALPAHAEEQSREVKKALAEMEEQIKRLKAEGKLDQPPEAPATTPKPVSQGCVRLAVGEAAIVDFNYENSPTGVEAHYGLSRQKDDVWVVELRNQYVKGPGYEDALTDKEVDEKYRRIVGGCLKEYENILKNERAGRKLIMRLTDNPSLPVNRIKIGEPWRNSSAYHLAANLSCEVVLHESLHLLGLPDEYPSEESADKSSDCRVTGPKDSVMYRQEEAVKRVTTPGKVYAVEMCQCEKKGDACWELAAKNDGKGKECPPGTTKFLKNLEPTIKVSLNSLNSSESFVLDEEKRVLNGEVAPTHTSALYPAHFRAITEPGCRDVNENYYGCVINAYRGAKIPGDPAKVGCYVRPPACQFNSMKWLE